jgi:hypothetical protein
MGIYQHPNDLTPWNPGVNQLHIPAECSAHPFLKVPIDTRVLKLSQWAYESKIETTRAIGKMMQSAMEDEDGPHEI